MGNLAAKLTRYSLVVALLMAVMGVIVFGLLVLLPAHLWNPLLARMAITPTNHLVLVNATGSLTEGQAWLAMQRNTSSKAADVPVKLSPISWRLDWSALMQGQVRLQLNEQGWLVFDNNTMRMTQLKVDIAAEHLTHFLQVDFAGTGWYGNLSLQVKELQCTRDALCEGQGAVLWRQMGTALFNATPYWGSYEAQWRVAKHTVSAEVRSAPGSKIQLQGTLQLADFRKSAPPVVELQARSDDNTLQRLRQLLGPYGQMRVQQDPYLQINIR